MKRKKKSVYLLLVIFLGITVGLSAKEYKADVADLTTAPLWIDFMKAIGEATGNKMVVSKYPFARSIAMVIEKKADIHVPMIELTDKAKIAKLPYDYSTVDIDDLVFILYTNKNKPINTDELKKGNKKNYNIETDFGHLDYFDFKCIGSASVEQSLKKVDSGRIDGFILAQIEVDNVLKELKLKNIKRQYFASFKVKFVIQKNQSGGELDRILTDGVKKLKANGRYEQIFGDYYLKHSTKYIEWQP